MGRPVSEVLKVYAVACAAIFAVTRLRGVPVVGDYVHLAVGAVFLLGALRQANREATDEDERRGLRRFGIEVGGLLAPADDGGGLFGLGELASTLRRGFPSALRETAVGVGTAAIIFPPFAIGFAWWHLARRGLPWENFTLSFPPDFASFALAQLVVVALPEEAFFRGFVQTRCADQWPAKETGLGRLLGISPAALVMQSALFALVHFVVIPHPAKLAVFFPGLVFGILRAKRGGIGAAMVFHALSNIYSATLMASWHLR